MALKPYSTCQIDIDTGFARFVYETGMQITMYPYNSLKQVVNFGTPITDGQIMYWYGFQGTAKPRKFVF